MKDWYCYINNQTYGPYPENLLMELINRGQLTADTYVYNDSPEEAPKGWQRAGDTEIAALSLNNSQGTPPLPPIQNQVTTSVSQETPEENYEKMKEMYKRYVMGNRETVYTRQQQGHSILFNILVAVAVAMASVVVLLNGGLIMLPISIGLIVLTLIVNIYWIVSPNHYFHL
jgi:hypothetical protein